MEASGTAIATLLRQSGREFESQIRGASMHPTLPDGARIRIRCGRFQISRGDIVAIAADPPIAHRVVERWRKDRRTFLLTRGDASWHCDVPVTENDILGLVTALHDGLGWRPPGACPRISRPSALRAWLSRRLILAAHGVSESLASRVARGVASVAGRWPRG